MVLALGWRPINNMPAVDLSSLSPAQKATALKLLRARDCTCGCGMKVAECRVKDPNCYYSKGLASIIVASLKAGKNEKEALADAEASRFAHPPEHKLLEDPIAIPTAGAPEIGPIDATITLAQSQVPVSGLKLSAARKYASRVRCSAPAGISPLWYV